jgi:hypothetical protein
MTDPVVAAVAALGMRPTTYIQPAGVGPWYDHTGKPVIDHNGNPAIPVGGPHGVCIFVWVNSPPGARQPQEWKETNKCASGHSCSPPLGGFTTMPIGTIVQTNCL